MIIGSFIFFLFVFVLIGVLSTLQSKGTNDDYLLAGQSVKPWLVALSAVATCNSGYMFIGMIGYTFYQGLSSIWLALGLIIGDFMASIFIHKRIRQVSEKEHILSFGGILARWNGTNYKKLKFIVGLVTLAFLGTYSAAQFAAGSKALNVLFGWYYSVGAIIGAIIVFLYCMAGGIRASIWTDAAQSLVMIVAMTLLFYVGVNELGGLSAFWGKVESVSPNYSQLMPYNLPLPGMSGTIAFMLGWLFGGFAVVGQPHIMVRFMTVDNSKNMNKVRTYYYLWYCAFYTVTVGVGLLAKVLLPVSNSFDAELALPTLANQLLPEILIGVVLAGLFAATMSTADSQFLSCSAAVTRDILQTKEEKPFLTKLATLGVTIVALCIALFGSKSVFALVIFAWSVLGAAFAPLLFFYSIGKKIKESTAITMVVSGTLVAFFWNHLGLSNITYEAFPGMIAGCFVFYAFEAIPYIIKKWNIFEKALETISIIPGINLVENKSE